MHRILLVPALALTAVALAACGSSAGSEGTSAGGAITVSSTADACTLSATSVGAGSTTFAVTNNGSEATEFYLYAEDGQQIIGEVEDIGPALTRELTVDLAAGTYQTACKPGQVGEGIRAPFTVVAS